MDGASIHQCQAERTPAAVFVGLSVMSNDLADLHRYTGAPRNATAVMCAVNQYLAQKRQEEARANESAAE